VTWLERAAEEAVGPGWGGGVHGHDSGGRGEEGGHRWHGRVSLELRGRAMGGGGVL
jgi:hypothetical protein